MRDTSKLVACVAIILLHLGATLSIEELHHHFFWEGGSSQQQSLKHDSGSNGPLEPLTTHHRCLACVQASQAVAYVTAAPHFDAIVPAYIVTSRFPLACFTGHDVMCPKRGPPVTQS